MGCSGGDDWKLRLAAEWNLERTAVLSCSDSNPRAVGSSTPSKRSNGCGRRSGETPANPCAAAGSVRIPRSPPSSRRSSASVRQAAASDSETSSSQPNPDGSSTSGTSSKTNSPPTCPPTISFTSAEIVIGPQVHSLFNLPPRPPIRCYGKVSAITQLTPGAITELTPLEPVSAYPRRAVLARLFQSAITSPFPSFDAVMGPGR